MSRLTMSNVRVLGQDPQKDQQAIEEAKQVLAAGGLVVFPTETVYGLAADSQNAQAQKRIYEVKGRSFDKPLSWHIGDWSQVQDQIEPLSEAANRLVEAFLPGPLTLICKRKGLEQTIGIRWPEHPVATGLASALGRPLSATSANVSDQGSISAIDQLDSELASKIDLILDAGPTVKQQDSTVLSIVQGDLNVLREGCIRLEQLQTVWDGA